MIRIDELLWQLKYHRKKWGNIRVRVLKGRRYVDLTDMPVMECGGVERAAVALAGENRKEESGYEVREKDGEWMLRKPRPAATPAPPLDMAQFTAFEFGYRCCEKGMNLQAAYAEYQKVTGGK